MKKDIPWRMMDANLNRVAEGLRVVEDLSRFQRANGEVSALARALRHRVRTAFSPYSKELLAARDSNNDPGLIVSRNQAVEGKNHNVDLEWANLKRAEEGLRVLEECAHLLAKQELAERELSKEIESLRFAVYDLETKIGREIVESEINSLTKKSPTRRPGSKKYNLPAGIYALTSEIHSLGRSNIEVAGEILDAGVPIIQYREKGKKFREMYEECQVLRAITKQHGALFIINDYLDLAQAVGADGVHIGQDDLPLSQMRQLAGLDLIIGVSTHSPAQAWAAVSGGADYIGVGPLFATNTKTDVCDPVGLNYLDYVVRNLDISFVAIGGVKEHNLPEVVKTGAQTVALVTEIVSSPNIGDKIKRLQHIMETPT